MNRGQSRRSTRVRAGSLATVLVFAATTHPVGAGVAPDTTPIDWLADGGTTRVGCVEVSARHFGLFPAENDEHANVYGFSKNSQLTWTFTPGIRDFQFLTWAHGDIEDPVHQYERFTIEAYDVDGDLVERLVVEDRDMTYDDYEFFEMYFDRRVETIDVSFTAVFPPGEASSGLIPFLKSNEGCTAGNLDGYLADLQTRAFTEEDNLALPRTL